MLSDVICECSVKFCALMLFFAFTIHTSKCHNFLCIMICFIDLMRWVYIISFECFFCVFVDKRSHENWAIWLWFHEFVKIEMFVEWFNYDTWICRCRSVCELIVLKSSAMCTIYLLRPFCWRGAILSTYIVYKSHYDDSYFLVYFDSWSV